MHIEKLLVKSIFAALTMLTSVALWSSEASPGWQEWESLGQPPVVKLAERQPSCVSGGGGQLHCFVIGSNGALYHKGWWSGTWHFWESLGIGTVAGEGITPRVDRLDCIAGGPNTVNELHCFAVGSAPSLLQHKGWWNGEWHDWQQKIRGGTIYHFPPSCVSWGADNLGDLHCFVVGDSPSEVDHVGWRDGTWQNWETLGIPYNPWDAIPSPVNCLSWGLDRPDQVHCFVIGSSVSPDGDMVGDTIWSDSLRHKGWWDGAWHDWENLQGPSGIDRLGTPNCTGWGLDKPNQLHCFVIGADHALYHKGWWDGTWHAWEDLGKPSGGGLRVDAPFRIAPNCLGWGVNTPNQLHCFAVGTNGMLQHRAWKDGTWLPWESLGQPASEIKSMPECAAWKHGAYSRLDCFVVASDGALWRKGWSDSLLEKAPPHSSKPDIPRIDIDKKEVNPIDPPIDVDPPIPPTGPKALERAPQ